MKIAQLDQLIPTLEPYFTTQAPAQLPQAWREAIVKFAPWVVIVVAVISVFGLISLFTALTIGSAILGSLAVVTGSGLLVFMSWISLIFMAVTIGLYFMAFPGLKAFSEDGWRMIFYSQIIGAVGVLVGFLGSFNFGGLLLGVIGVVIGLFVTFQVRDYYTGKATLSQVPATASAETPSAQE